MAWVAGAMGASPPKEEVRRRREAHCCREERLTRSQQNVKNLKSDTRRSWLP